MPSTSDDALAVALANGLTASDLCGDGSPGEANGRAPCLACQISGTGDLVAAQGVLIDLELAFVATVISPLQRVAVAQPLDPAHSPQGPPVA